MPGLDCLQKAQHDTHEVFISLLHVMGIARWLVCPYNSLPVHPSYDRGGDSETATGWISEMVAWVAEYMYRVAGGEAVVPVKVLRQQPLSPKQQSQQ